MNIAVEVQKELRHLKEIDLDIKPEECTRIYHVMKPRSCYNCKQEHHNGGCSYYYIDTEETLVTVSNGRTETQKPVGYCIPVKEESCLAQDNAHYLWHWYLKNIIEKIRGKNE